MKHLNGWRLNIQATTIVQNQQKTSKRIYLFIYLLIYLFIYLFTVDKFTINNRYNTAY